MHVLNLRYFILGTVYLFLCFSSLFLSIVFNYYPDSSFYLIAVKDVVTYISILTAVVLFNVPKKITIYIMLIFPLFFILLYGFFSSDANMIAKFASIRQMINIYVFALLGYLVINKLELERLFYKLQVYIVFIVVLFGFYEYFFEPWSTGIISDYFEAKSIPVNNNGVPFFFFEPTSFLAGVLDLSPVLPRMVSSFLDPINLGHNLVFWFFLLYYKKDLFVIGSLRYILMFLILIALFLTFSKGAWLQFVLVILLFGLKLNAFWKSLIIFLVISSLFYAADFHPGVRIHVSGFVHSIININLFGHGLGQVGNYASMFGVQKTVMIGDTYIGAVLGQVGVVGVLAWFFPIMIMLYRVNRLLGGSLAIRLIIPQLLIALFSENAFNLLSIINIGLLLGIELRRVDSSEFLKVYRF